MAGLKSGSSMGDIFWKRHFIALAAGVLIAGGLITSCTKGKEAQQMKKPAVPVIAEAATLQTVPVQLTAVGTVEPVLQVSVKSRVAGELTHVHFKEGQYVRKGDLLFTIDRRPFQTALDAAEAALERDRALAHKAREDVNRYTELLREELVSRSQYEQVMASAKALEATISADKAAVENARLQLGYCSLYAPLSGRAGSLLVHPGNQIKANDDRPMVVINQIQPISVSFAVTEKELPVIQQRMAKAKLKVEARITGEEDRPVEGTVDFVDNTVDQATGTIRLKGIFPNTDNRLWPGQFINVVLTLSVQKDAVVVQTAALQTGQQGQFVYIVREDQTAEMRPVSVSRSYQNYAVIETGLSGGEQVVTDGQMLLMPGAQVVVKTPGAEKTSGPAAGAKQ